MTLENVKSIPINSSLFCENFKINGALVNLEDECKGSFSIYVH